MKPIPIPRETADEAALFGALYAIHKWREAGKPVHVNMMIALMALHTAARSANPAISARAARELERIA